MKGLQLTAPANAQVVIQLAPVMLAFIGVFYFKEKLNFNQKVGAVIVVLGLLLFYEQQLSRVDLSLTTYNIGNLWILLGAITWAVWGALQKSLGHRMNPQLVNLIVYGVAAILTSLIVDISDIKSFTPATWALMIFLGLSTLAGYAALAEALKLIPINKVSMIIALNPIGTFIFLDILERAGVIWFVPEKITLMGYVGAAIFLTGVCLVVRKGKLST
jgi:drug/metabolite transporter (DMT)-like permease